MRELRLMSGYKPIKKIWGKSQNSFQAYFALSGFD